MIVPKAFFFTALCALSINLSSGQIDYTDDDVLSSLFGGSNLLNANDTNGPMKSEVTFWCHDKKTNRLVKTLINDPQISSKIDASKPLVTLTHGWLGSVRDPWITRLLRDIAKFNDVNVCGVDWNRLANFDYSISARRHVPAVGDYLAKFIEYVAKLGISLDDVTMVGHSMGGQICGQAGTRLAGKVGAIFGLDPAGPLFCFPSVNPINKRLDATDAKFVQIIHSSDRVLGCQVDHGHQDFRPDGGVVPQTPCIAPLPGQTITTDLITCSHSICVEYFRYSLDPKYVYTGHQCTSYSTFRSGSCLANPTDIIGLRSQRKAGRFYLNTRPVAPFTP